MERKYTETDKELMLKLLEMQELTAPISLSIGSVVNGQVTQGIILHEAPPKVVEDLVKDGYSLRARYGRVLRMRILHGTVEPRATSTQSAGTATLSASSSVSATRAVRQTLPRTGTLRTRPWHPRSS